jgi:hypothetical protein
VTCNVTTFEETDMDERVARLRTPEDCEQFAINVEERGKPELARDARRRAIELLAAKHGASTAVEREALEAIYAYERVLSAKHGRKTTASRTWPMIERHGIIKAVERIVSRKEEAAGYTALVKMGLQDMAFEALVLRHTNIFSAEAVERSRERLRGWSSS